MKTPAVLSNLVDKLKNQFSKWARLLDEEELSELRETIERSKEGSFIVLEPNGNSLPMHYDFEGLGLYSELEPVIYKTESPEGQQKLAHIRQGIEDIESRLKSRDITPSDDNHGKHNTL